MLQKFGDINSVPRTCCYLIHSTKIGTQSSYCDKSTKYKIVLDKDKNKTRDYDYLCPEHRAMVGGNYWEE